MASSCGLARDDDGSPNIGTDFRLGTPGVRVVAYVPDLSDGMQVVDLSTPATPRVVATYKTATPVRDVAVAHSLVYVVVGPPAQGNIPAGGGEVLILRETRTASQP